MAGYFYWFIHNWYYISKWDHLKNSITLNHLHPYLKAAIIYHTDKDFSSGDAVMDRCISTAISLSWAEEQTKTKGEQW